MVINIFLFDVLARRLTDKDYNNKVQLRNCLNTMGAVTEDAFCLKWNDFHTSLTSSFAELREESDLLDATVVCEGTPMRAHKLVLSACSGVFRNLFRQSSIGFLQGYVKQHRKFYLFILF